MISCFEGDHNHCNSWHGISCATNLITDIVLENNGLIGPFPSDFSDLHHLISLNVHYNSLIGIIPADLCTESKMNKIHIYGDAENCPNDFITDSGQYAAGCCDNILIDVDIYLNEFLSYVLGDSDCNNLGGGTESTVCNYMKNKSNHNIFANGYPESFHGDVWEWLKVS